MQSHRFASGINKSILTEMLRKSLVFALVAVSLVAAGSVGYTGGGRSLDMDHLIKQKKIFDLLMYVDKNVLIDTEYFEIGHNYDIMSNIDNYMDKQIVMDFMTRYKLGMLHKDGLFTYYKQEHREEMMLLYRLLYCAKDFSTFYKTACWARLHMNSGMFTTAFTTAVIYRDDTKYIRLPAIYEIYPNVFFDSKVIREAHRMVMSRGVSDLSHSMNIRKTDFDVDNMETYHVYSDMCFNPMYHHEYKLAYFTEDVGLNSYYYNFRMLFPFWMNTKEYNVPKDIRGDLYYYVHQQLMARYHLERLCNGLGEMEDFTWDRMDLPGFHSNILFNNGISMPKRDHWYMIPLYKLRYLEYLKKLEIRIMEAIDSGYVIDDTGKHISLMTTDGMNILGNMIEGNYDSINMNYYGSYDVLARNILGMNYDCHGKDCYIPSSLQLFSTSMKDPAFYRLYHKIVHFFLRYKSHLKRYTMDELRFPGVKFESVDVDKLYTYYDKRDFMINNAIDVSTMKHGKSFNIKTWQYYLNYKPFTYKMAINSEKTTKAVVRIFLGPADDKMKYDDYYYYLLHNYKYFFMLDEFDVSLHEGMNNIDRLSSESRFFVKDHMTGDMFYKKMIQSIEGKEPLVMSKHMAGFPDHLMLPKGTFDGMRFKLFFYIGPCDEMKTYEMPIFGDYHFYGKSFGFPLDRPMYPWFFHLENLYFKDVYIYHLKEHHETMMGEHKMHMMKDYDMMHMKDYQHHHHHDYMKMDDHHEDTYIRNEHHLDDHDMKHMHKMDRMRDIDMMHI